MIYDHIVGNLTDKGSLEFLARFSLGPAHNLDPTSYDKYLTAVQPFATEFEDAVMVALPTWLQNGYRLCEKPILGRGASGVVLALTTQPALAKVINIAQPCTSWSLHLTLAGFSTDL